MPCFDNLGTVYFTSDDAVFRVDKTTTDLQEIDEVSGSFALSPGLHAPETMPRTWPGLLL